jgi:hypothetical protein
MGACNNTPTIQHNHKNDSTTINNTPPIQLQPQKQQHNHQQHPSNTATTATKTTAQRSILQLYKIFYTGEIFEVEEQVSICKL